MPVQTSYPGIYIEELPNTTHTITAAPTSITVFIGHTHPFKTLTPGVAVRLFSFTDYERQFGGLFKSQILDSDVAYAVQQFFLNGGSDCYVVGIPPTLYDVSTGANLGLLPQATATRNGIVFTAIEPVDAGSPMTITVENPSPAGDVADITIVYGPTAETYRKVGIGTVASRLQNSALVTVDASGAAAAWTKVTQYAFTGGLVANATAFSELDYINVFETDGSLDKVPIFNLMAIPGVADAGVWSEALAFCERKRAFFIMDPPANASADGAGKANLPLMEDDMATIVPKSPNGAIYFPYLNSIDPLSPTTKRLAPSGYVAGVFARTDTNRGVWKAPAGLETILLNTTGVVAEGVMTDARQGTLNNVGVNCLRDFPNVGTVVFGARTLVSAVSGFDQWRYVSVRRMALFLEQTLVNNLGWVIFEPNDDPLWVAIRSNIERFMLSLFRQGAFQGTTPSDAFIVKCDSSTTTQQNIDDGIVNIIVGFRPLKPAEFVIIKIAQLAGQAQS
jgi:phage tail sheath protein FI